MFLETVPLIFATLLSYILLSSAFPFLNWGWLNLINGGKIGNILLTPVRETTNLLGAAGVAILIFFFVILFVSLPLLAFDEEKAYRQKRHTLKKIIPKSIQFGLEHLVMGIPITAAISLIIPGLFFAYRYEATYKKIREHSKARIANNEAVLISTAYHAMYNILLILAVAIIIFF